MYDVRIKWLTVACFEINIGQTTIVSDPYITAHSRNDLTWEDIENCDILTLSHGHWDHVTDIPVLMKKYPHAPLLTGSMIAPYMLKWLDENPSRILPMDTNLELDFGDVKIKSLFGRHRSLGKTNSALATSGRANKFFLDDPDSGGDLMAIGTLEYRNYLFTAKNGTKILLWGSYPSIEQKNLVRGLDVDIAIIQCTPADEQEMRGLAEVAAYSGAKVVIPHHMDFIRTKEEYTPKLEGVKREYLKLVPDGTFIHPQNGAWIDL